MYRLHPILGELGIPACKDLYKKILEEQGIVSIPDIILPEDAEDIRSSLQTLPTNWWTEHMNVSEKTIYNHTPIIIPDVEMEKKVALTETHKALDAGLPCCHYKLISAHLSPCRCVVCKTASMLNDKSFLSFIQFVTRKKVRAVDITASCYEKGHFYSPHPCKGRLGFILSMTKDWNPSWGGLIHFIKEKGKVEQTIIPSFNTLLIFTSSEGDQSHFVSEVTSRAYYSVSGWLDDALISPTNANKTSSPPTSPPLSNLWPWFE